MKLLKDKVAIITGAGSGLGKETAHLFAKEGAKVIVSDIDVDAANEVVKAIEKEGGTAFFIKADTSNPEHMEQLVKKTVDKYGGLHIAVNNAGIGGPQEALADYPVDGWEKIIGINLSGVFYGIKYQIPAMKKSGSGSIINMSSILGQVGSAGAAGYVAAKHGVVGLTKTTAVDYAKDNIRVNAVGPGYVYTNLVNEDAMGKEGIKDLESKHPMGRLGEPKEIAEMCLFLASDKASFCTGDYYPVNGGYLAV
ncbi:SDR family NAD(P)-dependent oxidoreductase [Mesonia ostreae]|uniref:SDR family oxidoreductase n=1 Tax=Mesonia ostreae TaxID=861110 RepID=A0ABU2KMD8_9FLAO|nr:glucose 1-dehydrogenase [Mesonia ostreae]MDT0295890.1 SDR family oxidoreductase [Mesonia ostreae]